MPIKAAFMVPHPPLIIPQVGNGNEKQVEATIRSYEQVADEIAALRPETIVISSPHIVMYGDYFHIPSGKGGEGSFSRFGAPQVSFNEEYDTELLDAIVTFAEKEGIPAGPEGARDPQLDHGTMVPLYFIRQRYQGGKIVRIGLSGLPLSEHYRLGQAVGRAVENLGRSVVWVASGDLSHKLQDYGPYGFAPEGPEYDRRLMEVCGLLDFDEDLCEKAAECGHRSFVMMAGALDGRQLKAHSYSHEDVTGVGYGICSFYPQPSPHVALARKALETYIREGRVMPIPEGLPAELTEKRAGAFVSIHEKGALRGCIGTILPVRECLAAELIDNAISASTRDPRFDPITEDELPLLDISVDVLEEPEDISSPAELDVKRYGVIVTKGFRRGLLLPDLDGVDTVEEQIAIAKRKAGIAPGEEVSLQRFEVIRHL